MNTEVLQTCPLCHSPITPEAPQGLCPRCLLAAASVPTESGQAAEPHIPPSRESVAAAFPQLEIFECVGQGGMGVVFKARQPKLDRFVALKLLPKKLDADPAFGERFNREARVLARLSHPNIVAVHDFGQAGPFFYLLMEFVDGVNLRQAMQVGRFTPAQALSLGPKICDALQYAHDEGVLHRDIKPENLLLDGRGRVKIADFGIAKLLGETKDVTLTAKGATIGTAHYMAPEQLERPQDVDQRADVYSLGVVFYEMLTGELPIGRFAPPSEKATMDPRVDEVVLRALEKERERRFQSAGAVKTEVETITSSQPKQDTPLKGSPFSDAGSLPPSTSSFQSPTTRSGWSIRAISAGLLVGLSILELALVMVGGGHVVPGDLPVLIIFIGIPALAGTLLGWLALSGLRRGEGQARGGKIAMIAAVAWPILLVDVALLLLAFLFLVSFQEHIMHSRSEALARLTAMVMLLAILPVDFLFLRYVLKQWISNRALPHAKLSEFAGRFSRPAVWLTVFTLVFVLPAFLILSLRKSNLQEPVQVMPVAEPVAPMGYEVPPGGLPGNDDHVYSAPMTIPPGYALTVTGILFSNRVGLEGNRTTASAYLLAPEERPVEARLTWRLLGNTTFGDGAPLQLAIVLPGSNKAERVFHLVPPEPITIEWIGEPTRLWPPQNGHTKFLLTKGVSSNPNGDNPIPTEWAVGIEENLHPIPVESLVHMKNPIVGLGKNENDYPSLAPLGRTLYEDPLPPGKKP